MVALSWLTCFQDLQWQRLHKPQCLPVLYFSDAANFDLHNSRVLSLEAKPIIGESARNLLFLVGEIIAGLEWMCATAAAAAHLSFSSRGRSRSVYFLCGATPLSSRFPSPTEGGSRAWPSTAFNGLLFSILSLCVQRESERNGHRAFPRQLTHALTQHRASWRARTVRA